MCICFVSQVEKQEDQKVSKEVRQKHDHKLGGEEGDNFELSLSLSLPQPSSQRSNGCSSTSEMGGEAISSYPNSNNSFKDCFGSSGRGRYNINLDLSIALCGT